MTDSAKWADLKTRLASAAVLTVVGGVAIWAGGIVFGALLVLIAGGMIWELAQMTAPTRPVSSFGLGVLGATVVGIILILSVPNTNQPLLVSLLVVPPLMMLVGPRSDKPVSVLYALAILVASYGLVMFRENHGVVWLVWLMLVVVVTDIAGYFAGRVIGGPKFWPAVSPKKTWAGTVAGWLAAAGLGFVFLQFTTAGPDLPWISAAISFASQIGDITESAIKRRAGVKDASALIPGHGGLLDRFDGMLGAAILMLIVAQFVVVPEVRL